VRQEIADLEKRWQDEARFRGLRAGMRLEREGVVLGAHTVLAKRLQDGALASDDARVFTLLSVAYGTPVDPSVVGAIRRASKHARAGDECMASMHLALAPLPGLPDPSDAARRLFIADGLMDGGVSPRDIWTALDFDPAPLDALEKDYNPNQPRVPAGSGRPSGQWTRDGAESEAADAAETAAADTMESAASNAAAEIATRGLIPRIISWAALVARYGSGPATFLSALLYSPPAGGGHYEGEIPGRPDLRYSWNGDETELDIVQISNGQVVMRATLGADGKFRNRGRAVARETKDGVVVDPSEIPSRQPKSLPDVDQEEPRLCPEPPVKDKPGLKGRSGDRARDYEMYMRERINPNNVTPAGLTYVLSNPEKNGRLVHFDDCQHEPGTINDSGTFNLPGSMIEFKGPGYAEKLADKGSWFRIAMLWQWPSQGLRQLQAAQGRQVIWYFAEQSALDYARYVFDNSKNERLRKIRLELGYWPEARRWK
jgi:hypothetical protein